MENTIENKAMFFAQYWGVKCLKNTLLNPDIPSHKVEIGNCKGLPQQFLELTPLSDITDEDAKKIAVLAYKISRGDIVSGKEYLHQFDKVNASYPTIISDFLRSKGYALPYMGLSVDKLIEYGWVKLK